MGDKGKRKKILEILNEKISSKGGFGDIFGYIGDHKECRNIVGKFLFQQSKLKKETEVSV